MAVKILAAALVIAFPGWQVLWYNVGSYGGYPGALFFGTLALWLSVRIAGGLSSRNEWVYISALGLVTGLGLWTNYLSASYILTGAILLVPYLLRNCFTARTLAKFVAGGCCFLVGISPVLFSYLKHGGGNVARFDFHWGYLKHTFNLTKNRYIPHLLDWPLELPRMPERGVNVCLIAALVLYGWRLVSAPTRNQRRRYGIPF